MAADSRLRRAVKSLLGPISDTDAYRIPQALSMAIDVRRGAWLEREAELIDRCVRPGDVVVDVGAHFGMWTYRLDRAVAPSGLVHALEPVPFTNSVLRMVAVLLRLRHTKVHSVAAGDEVGIADMVLPVQVTGALSAGQSHLATRIDDRPGREAHVRHPTEQTVQVEIVTIDSLVAGDRDISFMKLDIEGAELFALRGADRLIRQCRPVIVMEVNPWFLEGFGISVDEVFDHLEGLGYVGGRYENGELQEVGRAEVVEANYVFVHPDRPIRKA